MPKKINLPTELLTPQVAKIRNKILKKFDLEETFLMSTSGKNYVVRAKNKKGQSYLLKIRREKNTENKDDFTKEAIIFKYLSNKKTKQLIFPKVLTIDSAQEKKYLVYKYLKGFDLGMYFYLNKKAQTIVDYKSINNILNFIKRQTLPLLKKTSFKKANLKFYLNLMLQNQASFEKALTKKDFNNSLNIIKKNKELLEKNLTLAHGDFNPKNILIIKTANKKHLDRFSLIDWSDAILANPSYDLSFIYLAGWNHSNLNQKIEKNIKNQKLFYLNCLIHLPKMFEILDHYEKSVELDYINKFFDKKIKDRLFKLIFSARKYYLNIYKNKISTHL